MTRSVLLIAGENSGDKYGAGLVRAFKSSQPEVAFFGIGGPGLAEAGLERLHPMDALSTVGLVEVVSRLPRLFSILRSVVRAAASRRPAAAVLIDAPDFNLRLAPRLRRLGIPVLYYVSPTVWAWRAGRLKTIKRNVRKMLLIFPFEREIYERAGIPHAYVGHPLQDKVRASQDRETFRTRHHLDLRRPLVVLLPGSRTGEVLRHLPVLGPAADRLRTELGASCLIVRAESVAAETLRAAWPAGIELPPVLPAPGYDAMAAADLVVSSCGTANLEAALLETPFIAFYRVSPLTYLLGRPFVRIGRYSIVNILAGRTVVPELIQNRFTPETVFTEARRLLESDAERARIREDLGRIAALMKVENPSGNAAGELAALVGAAGPGS
jgi:lipid-A-disaccharide synthase